MSLYWQPASATDVSGSVPPLCSIAGRFRTAPEKGGDPLHAERGQSGCKRKSRRLDVDSSRTIKPSVIVLVIFELRVKLWPWFKTALTDASRRVCFGPTLPVNQASPVD